MNLVDRIARIRIELKDIDPTIRRRVEVPLTTSLKGLHDVIQAVMPFENYHLFRFDVGDNDTESPIENGIMCTRLSTRKISSSAP